MTTKDIEAIAAAVTRMQNAGIDARVQTLYGAEGEPSVVIIIPGVKLVNGKLEAVTSNSFIEHEAWRAG